MPDCSAKLACELTRLVQGLNKSAKILKVGWKMAVDVRAIEIDSLSHTVLSRRGI